MPFTWPMFVGHGARLLGGVLCLFDRRLRFNGMRIHDCFIEVIQL